MQEIRHFKPSTVSRAVPGRGRVLQDLRHRRPARALTGRARLAARGAPGITRLRVYSPAVRGPAHCRPQLHGPMRLPDEALRLLRLTPQETPGIAELSMRPTCILMH